MSENIRAWVEWLEQNPDQQIGLSNRLYDPATGKCCVWGAACLLAGLEPDENGAFEGEAEIPQ
jgi:hypothetical protein